MRVLTKVFSSSIRWGGGLSGRFDEIFGTTWFQEFPIIYLAHVIEQPNFQIPNPQYFVYLLDQTVGRDILQFIY